MAANFLPGRNQNLVDDLDFGLCGRVHVRISRPIHFSKRKKSNSNGPDHVFQIFVQFLYNLHTFFVPLSYTYCILLLKMISRQSNQKNLSFSGFVYLLNQYLNRFLFHYIMLIIESKWTSPIILHKQSHRIRIDRIQELVPKTFALMAFGERVVLWPIQLIN